MNLITETGEIDPVAIIKCAPQRAAREWGGENYPPKYLRESLDWLHERARMQRLAWRRDHGLKSDEPMEMRQVPSWGNSGDSFS